LDPLNLGRPEKGFPVSLAAPRLIALTCVLVLIHPSSLGAEFVAIWFTAQRQADAVAVFDVDPRRNVEGPTAGKAVTIDAAMLPWLCSAGGACPGDFDTGRGASPFIRNGVASAAIPPGAFEDVSAHPGGSISTFTPPDGGANDPATGGAGSDRTMREFIGGLFRDSLPFDPGGDPHAAIVGPGSIRGGGDPANVGLPNISSAEPSSWGTPSVGLPSGGAPSVGIPSVGIPSVGIPSVGIPGVGVPGVDIPEPAALPLFAIALLLLMVGRRTSTN
jgi:hypothetical protein